MKALVDNEIDVIQKFVLRQAENILRKRENAGYLHFLLFSKYFQNPPSFGSLKVGIAW